jgi:hypothetical protein
MPAMIRPRSRPDPDDPPARCFGTLDVVGLVAKTPLCDCPGCLAAALDIAGHLTGWRLPAGRDVPPRRLYRGLADACAPAILDQCPELGDALPVPPAQPGRMYMAWEATVVDTYGPTTWLRPIPGLGPIPYVEPEALVPYWPRLIAETSGQVLEPKHGALEALGLGVALRTGRRLLAGLAAPLTRRRHP